MMRNRQSVSHSLRRARAFGLSIVLLLAALLPAGAAGTAADVILRVADQAGQPVSGAAVEVYGLDQGLISLTATGPDGTVRLPYTAAERSLWMVRVSAKGYRVAESGWFDPAYGGVKTVWVEPVSGSLQILFRNRSGERVAADVALLSGAGRLVAQSRAEGGRFSQPSLPAGEYQLVASAQGYGTVVRSFTVTAGRMTVENVIMAPGGFTAAGEAVDGVTGAPLSGARVELLRDDQTVVADGVTGRNGRFSINSPLASGSYRLRVSAPGYGAALTDPERVEPGLHLDFSGLRAVRLSPLTGAIEGSLLHENGLPIPDTRVVLLREGFGEVAESRTGPKGEFRFEGLAAEKGYRYQVVADEALSSTRSGWHQLVASDWIAAKPGVTVQVSVVARSWYEYSFSPTVLGGRVITPAGLPVEGATVELLRYTRVQESTTTDAAGSFSFTAVPASEKDGFALTPYMLRVSKDGYVATRQVTVAGEERTIFSVPSGSRLALEATLRPAVTQLTGRVTDLRGAPVAGAQIELAVDDRPAPVRASTDAAGWYRLSGLPSAAGAATLRVAAPGYLPTAGIDVTEALADGQGLPTVQMTERTSVLEGVVVDFSGKPVSGAPVKLFVDGSPLAEGQTDSDGYYHLTADLTFATLGLLTVEQKGYTGGATLLSSLPEPGGRLSRSLLMQPSAAVLEGRVLDLAGRPVAAAEVELVSEGRGVVGRALSGPDGRYRFEQPLPEGAAWVWLRVRSVNGRFAGSQSHGLDYAPLTRLTAGDRLVVDLLVKP